MGLRKMGLRALLGSVSVLCFSLILNADPPSDSTSAPSEPAKGNVAERPDEQRLSVAAARERARLMHKIYAATLDVMHHYYFRENRPVLPARALEDVFEELDEKTKIQTRWIAVNTPAMSIQHEPKTEFEKKAATVIAAGQAEYGRVENGYYQHAGVIPLGSSCVSCHTRFFQRAPKTPRFAGLVISIPVKEE